MKPLPAFLFVLSVLSGCGKQGPEPDIIAMRVAAYRQDCVGVSPQKCLLVKTGNETNWTFFYDGIQNFTYEEGFEYQLLVRREPIANPPADGSSSRYTLAEIVEKIKQ